VTLGVTPTHPATGFGYIRTGEALAGFPTARPVVRFVEKPDAASASAYVASGEFLWNAGMFVAQASVLLDVLASYHPVLARGARAIAADLARLGEVWPTMARISVDHAVAEPAAAEGRVAVVPATFDWDDIGDFAALGALLPERPGGVRVLGDAGRVMARDATGLVVTGTTRLVVVIGLDDVVVVDTPDAVLVVATGRAQDVKAVVDTLRSTGRTGLT
ncbi:MAG TPA: sugar phosphate nucleotidyltransferase, partial [Candidatus Lustribacter sp.]|nr:sugar phosphate nucleotidyltransferase [Candidatus Lustribacter sp.]